MQPEETNPPRPQAPQTEAAASQPSRPAPMVPLTGVVTVQPPTEDQAKRAEPLMEPGEKLISVVHRHPIGLFAIYAGAAAAFAAFVTLLIFLSSDKTFKHLSGSTYRSIIGVTFLVMIILIIVLAVIIRVYKQSKLVVTDKSLVQVMQRSLFNRKISRLSMSNVEDVNAEKCGILPTIFNYGTLTIQTAGEEDNFIFPWCPDPDQHADSILQARQQYVQKYGDEHSTA